MFGKKRKIKELEMLNKALKEENAELDAKVLKLLKELDAEREFRNKSFEEDWDRINKESDSYIKSVYNNLDDIGELEDLLSSVCKSVSILSTVNPKVRLNAVHDVYKILSDALNEYQNCHKNSTREEVDTKKEVNPFNPTEEKAIIKENDVDDIVEG